MRMPLVLLHALFDFRGHPRRAFPHLSPSTSDERLDTCAACQWDLWLAMGLSFLQSGSGLRCVRGGVIVHTIGDQLHQRGLVVGPRLVQQALHRKVNSEYIVAVHSYAVNAVCAGFLCNRFRGSLSVKGYWKWPSDCSEWQRPPGTENSCEVKGFVKVTLGCGAVAGAAEHTAMRSPRIFAPQAMPAACGGETPP